jgi:hypothetical protein
MCVKKGEGTFAVRPFFANLLKHLARPLLVEELLPDDDERMPLLL